MPNTISTESATLETPPSATPPASAFPASFAQTRLWLVEQIEPGLPTYLVPFGLRLVGPLNPDALCQAFAALQARHESLRTSLELQDGELLQCIHGSAPLPWEMEDFSQVPSDQAECVVLRRSREEACRPFRLDQAPLWRARLFRVGPEDHRLVVVLHHAISDAWSLHLFQRELAEAYGCHCAGRTLTLPNLPFQYADYAVWQREMVEGDSGARQLAAWKDRLAGIPPLLSLPTDFPRNPKPDHAGGRCHWRMEDRLCTDLRRLCREQGLTEFIALLAAFTTVLHRLSGQTDVVVGTPVVARGQVELEGVIGLFLSTLPLRCDLAGNPTFLELLGRARDTVVHAFANQDIPFEKLVEELHPERSTDHTPVFQVFLNLVPAAPVPTGSWTGLKVEPIEPDTVTSKFDFTLYVQSSAEGLDFDLVYRKDLFSQARMEEFLRQLERFLREVVRSPEIRILAPSLAPTTLGTQGFPNPADPLPPTRGSHLTAAAREPARHSPTLVAIEDAWGKWTYHDLESRSNQLSHYLLSQGLGTGQFVGIHAVRGGALVCAMLAVLKAGAAFWIADASYPGAVLVARARRIQPSAWIRLSEAGEFPEALDSGTGDSTPATVPQVLIPATPHLDAWPARTYSDRPPEIAIDPHQPAYALFTSGSTGDPKAVVTSHEPVAHFVEWQIHEFGLSPGDRFSHLSGIGHDPFLRDVFTPLWLGATACVPAPEESDLASWFRRARVTVAHLTPGIARLLVQSENSSPLARLFFLGGDRVRADDVHSLRRWAPGARCVNFYGATETPQAVGYFEVPADNPEKPIADPIPIGHGAAGAQLLVLNTSQCLAGNGELGEIHVRTAHLSRGYLGDADATKERFVVNPFTGRSDDRMYRTGDLGRYRHDGVVEFAGRADRQVKIRGYRVEPSGIEAAIQRHPGIRQVALHARAVKGDEQELVAYYVTESGPVEPEELRQHLATRLAPFEVPHRLVRIPELPLNRHGKVDLQALERMAPLAAIDFNTNRTAPRSDTERRLARIWAEVLQRDTVGVNADFFELGGHSLLGLRLIERVQTEFQREISLRTLFESRTIADMARCLEPKPAGASPAQQLRGASRGVPLFVVPGYFGIGYLRPSLASVIGGVCPYYDRFRYAGVGDHRPPHQSIEAIARHLITQLDALWPPSCGPLCLAGFSFGGTVAFEIARQLHQQGRTVPLVLLYDTRMRRGLRPRSKLGIAWELLRRARRQPPGQRVAFLRRMIAARFGALRHIHPAPPAPTAPASDAAVSQETTHEIQPEVRRAGLVNEAVRLASIQAGLRYRPTPYPGRVVLFKATEELANEWLRLELDQFNGWRPFIVGDLEVVKVPRHHLGVYTEPLHPLVLERTVKLLRGVQPVAALH